jgi:hypothetical protein
MPSNEGRAAYYRLIREDSRGCSIVHPGHQIHWIQAHKSLQDEARLPVAVHVEPELGLVQFGVDGEPQLHWHHRPTRIVEIFQGHKGEAIWSPQFQILTVPSAYGPIHFSLSRLDQVRPC